MILETYDIHVNKFLKDLEKKFKKRNVTLHVSLRDYVILEKGKCNGFFDEIEKALYIATAKPLEEWFPTLVHESCHFDQWIQKDKIWKAYDRVCGDYSIDEVIAGNTPLTEAETLNYLKLARNTELDCERRVIKKIKKFKLPIDAKKYAKNASAYIMFYTYLLKYRHWYVMGKEPYTCKKILKHMPDNLNGKFARLPKKLVPLFHKCTTYRV